MESLINQSSTLHYHEDISNVNGISHNNCNINHINKNEIGESSFKKPMHPSNDGLLSPSSYILNSSDNEEDSNTSSLDINTSMLQQQHPQAIYHHHHHHHQAQPVIDLYQVPIYHQPQTIYNQQTNVYSPPIFKFHPSSPQTASIGIFNSDQNAIPFPAVPTTPTSPPSFYYVVNTQPTLIPIGYPISNQIQPSSPYRKRPFDQIKSNDGDYEADEENEEEEEEEDQEEEEEEYEEEEEQVKSPEFTTPQKPVFSSPNNNHINNSHNKSVSEPESNVTTPSLSSPSLPSPSPILSPTGLSNLPLPFLNGSNNSNNSHGNNNKENVLYVQLSDTQESIYKSLLKEHIPKMNSREHDQSTVLIELYNLLVACCNHPSLLSQHQQTQSNFIQSSGKLLNLEKLIENLSKLQSYQPSKKVIILTYFDSVLSILKDYLNLKSLKYYLNNINSFYNNDNYNNDLTILISTFQNFNQYHQQNSNQSINNCIIVEFDQFFDIQNMNSSILTQSYLKSMYYNTNDFSNNHIYKLISFSTIEEWVYLFKYQNQSNSTTCNQLNIKNELIEMMKFCIVKMSNYKKPSTPVQPTPISTTTSTNSPVTLTPISVLANNMSSSNLWRSNSGSKTLLVENSISPIGSQDSLKSKGNVEQEQKKKKHRSPKKQKVQGERVCFSCKKEEDCKGNGAFVQCRSCPMCYHRICVGLQNTPRSWKCIRHFCSQCKKTPNESGGSFFICKSCPLSYCITCLPDGVKILKKHEYIELKNKNNQDAHDDSATISVSAPSIPTSSIVSSPLSSSRSSTPQPISEHKSSSSSSLLPKKQKVQRPIVYIECETCFQQQTLNTTQEQKEITTTSSKYKTLSETTSSGLSTPTIAPVGIHLLQTSTSPSSSFINSSNQSPTTSSPLLSDSPSTPSYYLSSDTSSDYLN